MKAADNLGKSLNLKETEAMAWQMFLSFARLLLPSRHSTYELHFTRKSFAVFKCWMTKREECFWVTCWLRRMSCNIASNYDDYLRWLFGAVLFKISGLTLAPLETIRPRPSTAPRCYFFVFTPATTKENCCYANLRLWRVSVSAFFNLFTENIITKTTTTARTETIFTETSHKKSWFMIQKWKRSALIAFILWVKQSDKLLWTRSAPKKAI